MPRRLSAKYSKSLLPSRHDTVAVTFIICARVAREISHHVDEFYPFTLSFSTHRFSPRASNAELPNERHRHRRDTSVLDCHEEREGVGAPGSDMRQAVMLAMTDDGIVADIVATSVTCMRRRPSGNMTFVYILLSTAACKIGHRIILICSSIS